MTDQAVECLHHPAGFDEGCEFCVSEVNWYIGRYKDTLKDNTTKSGVLQSYGGTLHAGSLLETRLEMLLDVLFQRNPKDRAKFELAFAEKVKEILEQAMSEITKAKLVRNVPSDIRSLKRNK